MSMNERHPHTFYRLFYEMKVLEILNFTMRLLLMMGVLQYVWEYSSAVI
jgi:hypothetical protein